MLKKKSLQKMLFGARCECEIPSMYPKEKKTSTDTYPFEIVPCFGRTSVFLECFSPSRTPKQKKLKQDEEDKDEL